jgi:uncharacterized protein YecT (DUF1311 family)
MKGLVFALVAASAVLFAGPCLAQSGGAASAPLQQPAEDISQLRACAITAGLSDPAKLEACEKPILRTCNDDYAQCYDRLMAGWDGLLNMSFRELTRTGVLERRDSRNLQNAQRAWIKFRDEDCEFYGGVWPGSRAPGQLAACRHRETRSRAAVLTVRLEAAKKMRQAGAVAPTR